nr:retrovirus-related Pol polyprotein from transposon TNT 1-94 [Tanacetum cinerariifolium]
MSSVRTPQQNGVVERQNRTLVEAAITMLIFSRAPLFLWTEAIATACFTQNHSIIHHRFNKTPYELMNGRKPDISFLHVFDALCYPKNNREDIGKLGAKGDIGFFIGYSADSCAYRDSILPMLRQPSQRNNHMKDHPLEQVIGEPSRPVVTRNQLRSDGDMCMYALSVSSMKPKNVKEAMTNPAWIDSMLKIAFENADSNSRVELIPSKINLEDDNDDENYDKESKISMNTDIFETPSSDRIMTSSQIKEPEDSLIMEDEDINTIPEKESDEENESSVENLFHIPSEFEATFDNESEYDMPIFNDFSSLYNCKDDCVIFSRPLFDSYGDTTSCEYFSDNETFLGKDDTGKKNSDLHFEFDEESISSDVNPIYDEVLEDIDGTNYLIDSIIDSSKFDPLLEEFVGKLALINPIPSRIDEINFDHEEDIRLIEKLLYDNSSPRPPKEINSKNSIKPFSLSHIPVKDSDSLIEEIDTFLASDDSIPSGIDSDGYDSEDDDLFLDDSLIEEIDTFLASDDSIPLGIDSDGYDSEEDNLFLEYEPDPGELTRVVVEDIFGERRVHMPNVLPIHPTLCQDLDLTLSTDLSQDFQSRNID